MASCNTFRSRGEPIFGPLNRILSQLRSRGPYPCAFISGYVCRASVCESEPTIHAREGLSRYLSFAYDYGRVTIFAVPTRPGRNRRASFVSGIIPGKLNFNASTARSFASLRRWSFNPRVGSSDYWPGESRVETRGTSSFISGCCMYLVGIILWRYEWNSRSDNVVVSGNVLSNVFARCFCFYLMASYCGRITCGHCLHFNRSTVFDECTRRLDTQNDTNLLFTGFQVSLKMVYFLWSI